MGLPVTPVDPTVATASAPTPPPDLLEPREDPGAEFDRQADVLVAVGWPRLLGLSDAGFRAAVAPLRTEVPQAVPPDVAADDLVPFVLVVPVDVNDAVPAMRRRDRQGVSVIGREEARTYRTVDGVTVPEGTGYVLTGVDTGTEFCGIRPAAARAVIEGRGRTPLTMVEGIALVTVRPDMLRPNRCFSLMASRPQNQRVPAIWISERRPKLGWCWDGNPHTWLGAASAAGRVGATGT